MRVPTLEDTTKVIAPERGEYTVSYVIVGERTVMAATKAEAELKFAQFSLAELGEAGELQAYEPERDEQ